MVAATHRPPTEPVAPQTGLDDVTVAVCVLNREQDIAACLESVRACQPAVILVIDGGSTDNTAAVARHYTENVIYDPQHSGLGASRNLAARLAQTHYLAYIDSDVILPPTTLSQLLADLRRGNYVGVHAQIVGIYTSTYWERASDEHFKLTFNRAGPREAIGAVAVLYDRQVLLEENFDPLCSGAEDGEISYRLRKRGYRLGVSEAICYHRHRATFSAFVKQRIWYGKGTWAFFCKHRNLRMLLTALAFGPVGALWVLVKGKPLLVPYLLTHGVFFSIGVFIAALHANDRRRSA